MSEPKKRRRIVPQQITSPTKDRGSIEHALNAPINIDFREQERKGRELGPGRKIRFDLKPYQNEKRQVNWKRLLDAQASVNGGAAGGAGVVDAVDAVGAVDVVEGEGGAGGAGGAGGVAPEDGAPGTSRKRPWLAYLNAITRAMDSCNVINTSDSDDGYDPLPAEDDGEGDDDGSDDENDREGDVDGEVNLEDNADGGKAAAGSGSKGGTGEEGAKKKKSARGRGNSYDYQDDWIDDSEFIQMVEFTDNRKGKHRGFVIYRGKIERDEAENEAGYEYDEETGTRQRRRANARASKGSKAANGSKASKAANGSKASKAANAPKTSKASNGSKAATPGAKPNRAKKEAPPYEMPYDVREAIELIESVVASEALRAGGSSQNRKGSVPKRVREALLRGEPAFKPEIDRLGIPAQRAIVDRLMQSVGSFSSRQNINAYVTGKMGGTLKQDLVFSPDIVRDIVKELKPVADMSDDKPVFESEDTYLKHIPLVVLSKVAKQIRLGLQGETLESDRATAVLDEVLGCFPEATMDRASLLKLVPEVESYEKKIEEDAKKSKKRTKEADRGIRAVQAMGVQVNDLDLDIAVEKAVAQGADEQVMRELLDSDEVRDDEYWACALKLLAVAGPYGLKIKFIGTTGQTSGLLKKGKDLHIRTVASKITKLFNEHGDTVGKLKDSKGYWGLRAFTAADFEESEMRKPEESSSPVPTTAKCNSKSAIIGDKRPREEEGDEDGDDNEDDNDEDDNDEADNEDDDQEDNEDDDDQEDNEDDDQEDDEDDDQEDDGEDGDDNEGIEIDID